MPGSGEGGYNVKHWSLSWHFTAESAFHSAESAVYGAYLTTSRDKFTGVQIVHHDQVGVLKNKHKISTLHAVGIVISKPTPHPERKQAFLQTHALHTNGQTLPLKDSKGPSHLDQPIGPAMEAWI